MLDNNNTESTNNNNDETKEHHHHQHDSNLVITTKHKEFQVVIVSDDSLLKEAAAAAAASKQAASTTPIEIIKEENLEEQQKEDILDTSQLVVEEGYATKKMDEYFRQTIDEIKRELSKRVESHDDFELNELSHHHNNNDLINDINSQSTGGAILSTATACVNINNQNNVIISPNSPNNNNNNINKDNENIINDGNHHHNIRTSLNCVDCFLNGHCVLHNPNNHNSNISSPLNDGANNKNIRFGNLINWFLIIGSIINHVLIDGFCYNYSNLFLYIEKAYTIQNDEFNELDDNVLNSSSTANKTNYSKLLFTLPGSLLISIYLLFIPISLYISKRFGIRPVALVGSLISTLSILATSFLKMNFVLFILFYSLINGTYYLLSFPI